MSIEPNNTPEAPTHKGSISSHAHINPPKNESPRSKLSLLNSYYWAEILAKVGLLIAGIFAYVQFLDVKETRRVDRTFTYVEQFENGRVSEARRLIRAKMRPYLDQFQEISETGGINLSDRREIILLLVEEDTDQSFADAIETVVDFYEGLKLCEDERLCSRSVIQGYFCPGRAKPFYQDFAPYINLRRENSELFGRALEWCGLGQILPMPRSN